MAGNAVIGALRVVIGADSAALEKGLADASSRLATFGSNVAKAGLAAGAAFTAAAAGVAYAVKGVIDEADKLGKMSQKIGVPVEDLSALKYAAELSDVSIEALGKSMGKLSKAMVEAAAKPTGDAANAFKALGISATDSNGKLKSTQDVLLDIAGKFEGLKDGAGKTAVSMMLFGKAGAELIPMLNAGKTGIKALTDEAAEFGIVITSQTAKAAEGFNDNLKRLSAVKNALYVQIASQLLPTLMKLSEVFLQNAKDGSMAKQAADFIGSSMLGLTETVMTVLTAWKRLGAEFGALKEFLTTPFSAKSWEKFNEAGKETERVFATLHASFENDPIGKTSDALAAASVNAGNASKNLKDFNYSALSSKTALDQFIDSQKKSQAAQEAELATVGLAAGAKERLKVVLQALQIATANQIPITDALRLKISETAFAAEQLGLKIAGAQLIQQNLAPLQAYTMELNNSTTAMIAAGASQDQLARNAQNVADKFGMSASAIGTSIAGTMGALSNLSATFASENKAMGIASKAFGIGQAIINTSIAVTKALATLPPPASYAAAAFAAAQGAAQIATISMQKFAMGGSFRVPGGVGGGDKVPVSFMAEPGEQVDISSNRSTGHRGGGAGGSPVLIQLIGDTMGVKQVRDLIGRISDELQDGSRLRLVPA